MSTHAKYQEKNKCRRKIKMWGACQFRHIVKEIHWTGEIWVKFQRRRKKSSLLKI